MGTGHTMHGHGAHYAWAHGTLSDLDRIGLNRLFQGKRIPAFLCGANPFSTKCSPDTR